MATAFESRKDRTARRDRRTAACWTGRRYGLLGKPMEVKGKTLDGKDFNLESLKGKVVLVDFWATWCGPCIAEMPHVRELYEGYHGKGFEVVGISLDEKKEVLQAFLAEEKLPWVQLYSETEGNTGGRIPIAEYYGISSIPTAILIGTGRQRRVAGCPGRRTDEAARKAPRPAGSEAGSAQGRRS